MMPRGRDAACEETSERPFLETKEILGGFVVVGVPSMDEAVAMAAEWPSLASQPNATVQVREGFVRS